MIVWIDAQISPALAPWLARRFRVEARSVRDVGLRDATDPRIFAAARLAKAVVVTKDEDFVELQRRRGAPPQIVWLTCGNTSNKRLRAIFNAAFPRALSMLRAGEDLVEIGGES
jgi:predicted nuclease of predicted toxin-antitoxin system